MVFSTLSVMYSPLNKKPNQLNSVINRKPNQLNIVINKKGLPRSTGNPFFNTKTIIMHYKCSLFF